MGQTAHDRLVTRGLLCSAWRAMTIPINARGAQCRAACYTGAAQRNTQDATQHTYGTMGQTAHDRLVTRGLLCSAWRAVTIPIYARGAQVADNRALICVCVGNYCQLIKVAYTRVNELTCDSPQRPSQRLIGNSWAHKLKLTINWAREVSNLSL